MDGGLWSLFATANKTVGDLVGPLVTLKTVNNKCAVCVFCGWVGM